MTNISAEIIGKWKQLCRLLISYNDFKHAADIAHYYLENDYEVNRIEWEEGDYYKRRVIGEAMSCAMIIAYARPFSGNDKIALEKIPDLPDRYVRRLDERGRQVHGFIIKARNSRMAHSDSDAWEMVPQILDLGEGRKLVAPVHNDTREPLSRDDIRILMSNCSTFMESIIAARQDIEKQLQEYLPVLKEAERDG